MLGDGASLEVLERLAAERGLIMMCVQGLLVWRAREGEDLTWDKSNPKDAMLIARLTTQLRCYEPETSDATWSRLRQLDARHSRLLTESTSCGQQLRNLLECVWPAVLEAAERPLESPSQEKRIGAGHIRNIYDVTRRMFTAAVDDGVISGARMPCRPITLPPPDGEEVVPPTAEKVAELTAAVPERYRALVVLLAGSGLRIGEALGLRVGDIDFLRREVRVRQQRASTSGKISPCKTAGSVRTVPVGRVVVDELAAHLAAFGDGDEWPFLTAYGKPLTYSSWIEVWTAAQRIERTLRRSYVCPHCQAGAGEACRKANGKAANVDHSERDDLARGAEGVDTHGLRHFYASCLIAGGASVTRVGKRLGHASACRCASTPRGRTASRRHARNFPANSARRCAASCARPLNGSSAPARPSGSR